MTRHSVRAVLDRGVCGGGRELRDARSGTVVLLPDKDGKDTALTVKQRGTDR